MNKAVHSGKKSKKNVIIAVVLIIIIAAAAIFFITRPDNFEEYAARHEEVTEELSKKFGEEFTVITYKENRIVIESRVAAGMSDDDVKSFTESLQGRDNMVGEVVFPLLAELKEKSGMEDISIEMAYYGKEDEELFRNVFE